MTQTTETAVLPFKVQELAEIIMNKKHLSLSDALLYLYNSRLYETLTDPSAKLWYESGASLYEQLETEKSATKEAVQSRAETMFLIFCIEQYRLSHNTTSAATLSLFRQSGTDEFLTANFEMLHSQSNEYILHEIDLYLKRHK